MPDADATRARSTSGWQSLFAVGDIVAGNYLILGYAGKGGMGVVYRARDLKLERTVALKFLPEEVTASEKEQQRFLTEARMAAALDHPDIGAIYGIESTGDSRGFIVMAFYDGQSLAERIHLGGAMKLPEILDTAKQMTRGLAEAHSHNIIHRDIKPSNVMFTSSGLVKIVDFGLAHVSEQTATLTHGAVLEETHEPRDSRSSKPTKPPSDLRRSREEASRSALSVEWPQSRKRAWVTVTAVVVVLIAAGTVAYLGLGRSWWQNRMSQGQSEAANVPNPAVLALLPFAPDAGDSHLTALGQGLVESVGSKL